MYGLKTTDASTAGFLAGTTVVLVPILNAILKRKIPEKKVFFRYDSSYLRCGIDVGERWSYHDGGRMALYWREPAVMPCKLL